jgi:glycosyltransferase involved in cell wall biosynthesis
MTHPLHICFLSQEYPPETGWGGIGAYTYEMAHGLARAGQKVTVISLAEGPEAVTRGEDGVEVHRISRRPDWARRKGLWRVNRVWPGFAWAAAGRLRQVDARFPVDVVEAAECRADSLFVPMRRRRPRLVVRLHTAWVFVDRLNGVIPDWKKWLIYREEALAIRCADAITAPSQAVVDLTRTWVSLGRRPVRVIPNPVDAAVYSPVVSERASEVLVIGRLEQRKGAGVLADALPSILRRCPRSSFRFVGSDGADSAGRSWRERLVEYVPAADRTRVHFEQVARSELIHRYHRTGVCALPSVWENFPYALLEAMACGVPVVGTHTGGLPELIEDKVSGLIVPKADPAALAEGLCGLLEDDKMRTRMGDAARKRVEDLYSVERVVPAMLDFYREVCGGGPS